MKIDQIIIKQDTNPDLAQFFPPKKRLMIGLGIGLFAISLFVIGLIFIPDISTIGFAVIGGGLPLLLLIWLRPEFGLVLVIFLAASLIRSDIVDLRLSIGGLELRDLILLGMLGLMGLKGLIHKNLVIPWWQVGVPLLIFLVLALVSTMYALFFQHVAAKWVFSELRALVFYCVFFLTGWVITNRRQMVTVIVGLFIIAILISGVVILQQFYGTNSFLIAAMQYSNWRLYEMQQAGGAWRFGMVRIMPPGVTLVYFMMILAFCLLIFNSNNPRSRIVYGSLCAFLNIGLLLTYTRALWIAMAFSVGLVLLVIFPTYRARLIRILMAGIVLIYLLISFISIMPLRSIGGSDALNTVAERFLSILSPKDTLESDSLQWRVFENGKSMDSISKNPFIGVGLGNSYREMTTLQGEMFGWRTGKNLEPDTISRFTRFVHNSYLYVAVKMGLPGLICFLWFCMALMIQSWRLYKNLSGSQSRGIVLAVLVSILGLLLWSFFHEHFMKTESTAIIGLMAGLVASIQHNVNEKGSLHQKA